jgi:hypothetical protein
MTASGANVRFRRSIPHTLGTYAPPVEGLAINLV